MKKNRIICIFLLFALCLVSLSSCSDVIKLSDIGNGEYYDQENDVSYKAVTSEYEPIAYGVEYAQWKVNGEKVILYTVEGLEPTKWLYCVQFGTLFCASDISVPDPKTLDYSKMIICLEEAQTWSVFELDDMVEISSIMINMNDGETMQYPSTEATYSYRLKFVSAELPGIYYTVAYYEYTETQTGCFYFREDNQRCVISNKLFSEYLEDDE